MKLWSAGRLKWLRWQDEEVACGQLALTAKALDREAAYAAPLRGGQAVVSRTTSIPLGHLVQEGGIHDYDDQDKDSQGPHMA